MPRRKDHRKNIACLESLWNSDIENRLSVVPILDLVSKVDGIRYTCVNWIASAALDLLLFDWLQYYGDTRRLWKDFRRRHVELIRRTGLKAFHA
ncbi:MAG: hypothetical protein FJY54_08680 [Betaproteobacteria bacterium]|nr:hypothetical protein [Betaproteobacteria bacterium]